MNLRSKTPAGTQALRRGLALLKALTDERPEATLTTLAHETGLNKTTTHRLLGALEAEGLLVRVGDAYRLGPEMAVLGARAARSRDLIALARAELLLLAHETGETATLEVRAADDALIIDEVPGRYLVASMPAVGTRWPAHATATGKVLLAFANDLPDGRLRRHTKHTITSTRKLADEFEQVRNRGFATNEEELEIGFVAVAAPVIDHANRVVAAISIGGPAARLTNERISAAAARVKRAASRISQQLGHRT